ncbi:MAG: peptidoglycan-associated lipoprotein Pal [Candidatus Tectomicrobia bacterium]|uniref:Peptidoglycan-associated protein n=1 Tax=Tectimicrobiota bacterium TaxID=2528274 RepID=A0A932MQG4_UNCTE|nr:peptidoglycan-associated lipoprotein Pal [Candidatus Tectomicrobia bacterium]
MSQAASWKRVGLAMLGVALLAVTTGCAQQTVKSDEAVTSAPGARAGQQEAGSMTEAERQRRREAFKSGLASFENDLVHFDFDKSEIRPDMRPIMDAKGKFLADNPTIKIQIEGHADERGTVQYNIALGHRRSQAAKDYLVSLGVDASRIETVSFGKERPLDPRRNELAWAKNRRAKFNVTGGIPAGMN